MLRAAHKAAFFNSFTVAKATLFSKNGQKDCENQKKVVILPLQYHDYCGKINVINNIESLKLKDMKKILTLVCLVMLGIGMGNAQVRQGESAVGINLSYGSEIESLGLGARYQYGFLDQLRGEVGFNFFFEHNHVKWTDVNINAHYLVGLRNEQLYIYPIAGLNFTFVKYKAELDKNKDENNHVGLNLGAGIEYEITEHFGACFEYRHTIIKDVDQGIFSLGLNYKF